MFNCVDVDECELGFHECHANAACTDLEGSYDCTCDEGFYGNGWTCNLIGMSLCVCVQ